MLYVEFAIHLQFTIQLNLFPSWTIFIVQFHLKLRNKRSSGKGCGSERSYRGKVDRLENPDQQNHIERHHQCKADCDEV